MDTDRSRQLDARWYERGWRDVGPSSGEQGQSLTLGELRAAIAELDDEPDSVLVQTSYEAVTGAAIGPVEDGTRVLRLLAG